MNKFSFNFIFSILFLFFISSCSEEREKIHVRWIVDGELEPPAPAATLEQERGFVGADLNQNLIRDDVERYINRLFPGLENKPHRIYFAALAKVYQKILILKSKSELTREKSIHLLSQMAIIIDCRKSHYGSIFERPYTPYDDSTILDAIKKEVFNTGPREIVYSEWRKNLVGFMGEGTERSQAVCEAFWNGDV